MTIPTFTISVRLKTSALDGTKDTTGEFKCEDQSDFDDKLEQLNTQFEVNWVEGDFELTSCSVDDTGWEEVRDALRSRDLSSVLALADLAGALYRDDQGSAKVFYALSELGLGIHDIDSVAVRDIDLTTDRLERAAQAYSNDCGDKAPGQLARYIDWTAYGDQLVTDGEWCTFEHDGTAYICLNHPQN